MTPLRNSDMRKEIGLVPDGWDVLPFSAVREFLQYGSSTRCEHDASGSPVLRIPNIQLGNVDTTDLKYAALSASEVDRYSLRQGDLIFVRTNGVLERLGSCAVYSGDPPGALFASYLIRARLKLELIDPYFAAYFFASKQGSGLVAGRATPAADGKYNLNTGAIDSLPIALPPTLAEQHAIASALTRIREAIDQHRRAAAAALTLRKSVMQALFTKGVHSEPRKETEIGPIPESWELRSVLDLCEIWSGGTPCKSVPEYWSGSIPWVSGKDLKLPTLNDTIDHISDAGVEAGSKLAPADSVLLLVRGMGLAKDLPVARITRPMAFNQDIKALVSRGDLSGSFIRFVIHACKQRLLSRIVPSAHGTLTLNLDDVETFKVPCPTNEGEAEEIVAILDVIDLKIDLHKRKRAVLDELFKSLLHKLMTGEIRVGDLELSPLGSAATQVVAT